MGAGASAGEIKTAVRDTPDDKLKVTLAELPPTQRERLLEALNATPAAAAAVGYDTPRLLPTSKSPCEVVLLIGPPASGKSTLAARLAERLGCPHLDIGAHLRELRPSVSEADACTIAAVENALQKGGKLLLNGFPKKLEGVEVWERSWPAAHIAVALVLEAPDAELCRRGAQRHEAGVRPEDHKEGFEERLALFHKYTSKVVQHFSTRGLTAIVDATIEPAAVEAAAVAHLSGKLGEFAPPLGLGAPARQLEPASTKEQFVKVTVVQVSGAVVFKEREFAAAALFNTVLEEVSKALDRKAFDILDKTGANLRLEDGARLCKLDTPIGEALTDGEVLTAVVKDPPKIPSPPSSSANSRSSWNCNMCVNGEAGVLLASGETKQAKEIRVGDRLAVPFGGGTSVRAVITELLSDHEVVQLGELVITKPHRVFIGEQWILPEEAPGATLVQRSLRVYNWITDNRDAMVIEGIACATIGTYCPGACDFKKPTHRLWGSDLIVSLFEKHPDWPHIECGGANEVYYNLLLQQHPRWPQIDDDGDTSDGRIGCDGKGPIGIKCS